MVSIIIPVYNVEPYLNKCLDSVICQTYKKLEIILVDDGSTDNSGAICDNYQKKDSRIRVIHQKNGGLSNARNSGMKLARGEFIFFLDSDDYISTQCIETLTDAIKNNHADIAIGSHITVNEEAKDEPNTTSRHDYPLQIWTKEEALTNLLYQKNTTCSAWGKLYKKAIVDIAEFPDGELFEDYYTVFFYTANSTRIVYTDHPLYFYLKRKNSITKSHYSHRMMDYIKHGQQMMDYIEKNYPKLICAGIARQLWACTYIIAHLDNANEYSSDEQICWDFIKKNRSTVIKDKNATAKYKMVAFLSFFGKKAIRTVYHTLNR